MTVSDTQSRAWREWEHALAGGRPHHAWLLSAPPGSGKTVFALAAAHRLVAPGPQTGHPDIVHLTHEAKNSAEERKRDEGKPFETRRNLTVDQIRRMQARLATRPTLGSERVVIVDPADDMEKGASNALLKSLEEPPQGTTFLLVAHRPARLLPTIRSRCRMLRLDPVPPDAGEEGGNTIELLARIADTGDADHRLRQELARQLGAYAKAPVVASLLACAQTALRRTAVASRPDGIADAHAQLTQLANQHATYNFDAGLLVARVGDLLAEAGGHRTRADG